MLILTVLTGWAGVAALAQEPPPVEGAPEMPRLEGRITGRVKQHVPKPRSDAPIPVEIELDYNSDKILRGELELELMYGSSTIARVRSPEVVITRDKRVERFTLPPFETYGLEDWAVLRMTLDTGDKRIQIDGQQVSAPTTSQRQLVVGLAGSASMGSGLAMSLNPTDFRPNKDDKSISLFPARIDPERLPTQPLDYTAYDVVVLTRDAFAAADERELEALAAWVKAGGSILAVCGDSLAQRHAGFLNAISGEAGAKYALDPEGKITLNGQTPPEGVLMYAPGVGRSAVTFQPARLEEMTAEPGWKTVVCHLWKMRADRTREALSSAGVWTEEPNADARRLGLHSGLNSPMPMDFGSQLSDSLMPQDVRVIEFWVIVLILSLFTLAVGPGDYLVLGLFRQRKLTWVLFPLVAAAFTISTVVIAEHYMGSTDQKRSVVVSDVGPDGSVLRTTTLEQSFLSREQTVTEEVQGQWVQPVAGDMLRSGNQNDYWRDPERAYASVQLAGRVPDRYTISRRVFQWKPDLIRRTTIPMPGSPPSKPRHAIAWPEDGTDPGAVNGAQLIAGLPPGSKALLFRTLGNILNIQPLAGPADTTIEGRWANELTSRRPTGFFHIVSQVSPSGGTTLEDVSVFDSSDPTRWMLVVWVPDGEDYYIYRRLYRK